MLCKEDNKKISSQIINIKDAKVALWNFISLLRKKSIEFFQFILWKWRKYTFLIFISNMETWKLHEKREKKLFSISWHIADWEWEFCISVQRKLEEKISNERINKCKQCPAVCLWRGERVDKQHR